MFEKLTKRFDLVAKAMNRLSKLKLTGQLTELKVPDGFLQLKMIGKLTEITTAEELLKLKVTGELTELELSDKPLELKANAEKGGREASAGSSNSLSFLQTAKQNLLGQISKLNQFAQSIQQKTVNLVKGAGKGLFNQLNKLNIFSKFFNSINRGLVYINKSFNGLKTLFNKISQTKAGAFFGKTLKGIGKGLKPFGKILFPFTRGRLGKSNLSANGNGSGGGANDSIISQALSFDNVKGALSATMGAGMKQQQTKGAFIARAGNAQLGGAIYDQVAKQALQYGQKPEDALSSAMSFTSATLDPGKLTEMNKLAMRLAQMNPEKGLDGAASSMMDLFKGESSSMVDDFGMGESSVEASAALKAGKAGDINGFIKGMDELLNKRNMTEQAFEGMMKSPAAQWEKAVNGFQFSLGLVGQMGLEAFGPLITMITEAFDSGKFTPFFTMLGKGLYIAVSVVTWLVEGFMGLLNFLAANLPVITSLILAGLVVALWMMVPPLLSQAIAWLTMNWPIIMIIGIIALLIYALQQMGVTTNQIVGFTTGIFYGLFAYLKNCVAYIWNIFISFKEFIMNVFKDPVYAIKKLFYDLAKNIGGFFSSVINGVLSGINTLIQQANKIGINIPLIPEMNVDEWLEDLKPTSDKNVVDLSNEKMQFDNLGDAFNTGFNKGEKLMDGLSSMKNPFNLDSKYGDAIPPIDNIKKVEEVGSINDTVEVSGEDLATMRELAEMKNIQNFVQMTPSVNVQTGDIRQESDINSIVARIEQVLTEQIVSSAQGVYGT